MKHPQVRRTALWCQLLAHSCHQNCCNLASTWYYEGCRGCRSAGLAVSPCQKGLQSCSHVRPGQKLPQQLRSQVPRASRIPQLVLAGLQKTLCQRGKLPARQARGGLQQENCEVFGG